MNNLFSSNMFTAIVSTKEVTVISGDVSGGDVYSDPGMNTEEGMYVDPSMTTVKDPLLSSWPFVIGISTAILFVSVGLGILLAKRKIKKGIELYED